MLRITPTGSLAIAKERRYLYSGEGWQSPSFDQVIRFTSRLVKRLVLCASWCVARSIQLYPHSVRPPDVSSESNCGFRHIFQCIGNIGHREMHYKISCGNRHIQNVGKSTRQLSWFLQKVNVKRNRQDKWLNCVLSNFLFLKIPMGCHILDSTYLSRCGVYTHTHTCVHIKEYYSPMKKNEILLFVDGPWWHYAKWNKSEKVKYCMTSLTCEV